MPIRIKGNLFSKKKYTKRTSRKRIQKSLMRYSHINSMVSNYYDTTTFTQTTGSTAVSVGVQFGLTGVALSAGQVVFAPSSATEIFNLYDQYKLNKIVFMLIPTFNINSTTFDTTNTLGTFPGIHSVIDYNNTNTLSVAQMTEYNNYKYSRGGQIHKRVFTPKINAQLNDNGVNTAFQNEWPKWINTATQNGASTTLARHFGLVIATDPTTGYTPETPTTFTYCVRIKFYLQLKNNK